MSNVFEGTRFCIHTFGCQMNKHDSERVAGMLEGLGSLPVETIEEADIVVFMTCCVREAADTRLYGQVASMKNIPLRDGTPLDKRYIAVGGCIGQRDGDKLLAALPHLDVVFGTHNLGSLPGLLRRAIEQHGRAAEVIEGGAEFSSALPTVREHDWAAWLPITMGCNNFCSYCIVPYVRGREKSRPLDDIAAEARSYVEAGVKEITLLGQNVNSYGRDLYGEPRFADVLRAVDAAGIERLRFATSHPKDLTDEVIGLFATLPSLMPALHLPVQSGSNRILSAMNRRYTREHYLGLIEKLRRARPDIALSTDIIVGFPGETEEDFRTPIASWRKSATARCSRSFTPSARGRLLRRWTTTRPARSSRSASTGSSISSSARPSRRTRPSSAPRCPSWSRARPSATIPSWPARARRTRPFTLRCPPARRRRLWWGASCP